MVLVGVYGSLRTGMSNHSLIEGCPKVGNCNIEGYSLYALQHAGFPYACKNEGGTTLIEVFSVDARTLALLDALEGHPNWYVRTKLDTVFGEVEVYIMPDERVKGYGRIESNDWTAHVIGRRANH